MVLLPSSFGVVDVLASPFRYVLLAVYGLGFWLQQTAFQSGEAVVAIGVMVAATNAVPIAAGLAVLGDPLPSEPVLLALRLGGFVLVVAGSVLLGRVSEGAGGVAAEPVPSLSREGAAGA
jgi:hypothetical protein